MQRLVDEHEVILSVLDALEHAATDAGRKFDRGFYEDVVEFCGVFADRFHHAKEEDELFPALERAGMSAEQGPIAVMLSDHRDGRAHIKAIREAIPAAADGDGRAYDLIRREAMAYVEMLRAHIQKENLVLFVMSDRILDEAAKEVLRKRFDAQQQSEAARFRAMADSLQKRARAPREVCRHCA
jgi:hemerythrin-like domain-containing protein